VSKKERDAFVAGWRECLDALNDLDSHDHSTAEQRAIRRYPEEPAAQTREQAMAQLQKDIADGKLLPAAPEPPAEAGIIRKGADCICRDGTSSDPNCPVHKSAPPAPASTATPAATKQKGEFDSTPIPNRCTECGRENISLEEQWDGGHGDPKWCGPVVPEAPAPAWDDPCPECGASGGRHEFGCWRGLKPAPAATKRWWTHKCLTCGGGVNLARGENASNFSGHFKRDGTFCGGPVVPETPGKERQ
jgi:hypothetical protein